MRTAITLDEFIFTLNQDEDILITIRDHNWDLEYRGWKSDLRKWKSGLVGHEYADFKNWFVQDFILTEGGVEITIVELPEFLD